MFSYPINICLIDSFEPRPERITHPFVVKAVEASYLHPALLLSTIHFVAGLAAAPLGSTALLAYNFVNQAAQTHPLLTWSHFYEVIDQIATHLGATLTGEWFD